MEGINVTKKERVQVNKAQAIFKRISPSLIGVAVIAAGVFIGCFVSFYVFSPSTSGSSENLASGDYADTSGADLNKTCSVQGIELRGSIYTYMPVGAENSADFDYDYVTSDDVLWYINKANEDLGIRAILVEVDSGGGSPVAGEEIANAIKASKKPVVAVIRSVGASSAYWAISSADRIFASANSDVGSIGVTMSYLSNVEKNNKEGLTYEQITSGKYKDLGIPDKPLTIEDKNMLLRDVNIIYNNFVKAVSENRNIPIAKVRSFADGSSVLGERAKELGMIDEIGGITEAESYLEGVISTKLEVCW
jgi:protease-4